MAKLKIYGTPLSRASRVLWTALELGIDFELVPVDIHKGEGKKPGYLKVNPAGRVPSIDDDGLILSESLAINLYLAKKHGGALAPKDAAEEAKTLQWTSWAINYFENQTGHLIQNAMKPEAERDAALPERIRGEIAPSLEILNDHLAGNEFVLGGRFTVADINVAATLSPTLRTGFDISMYPNLEKWLKACMARPNFSAAREIKVPEAA